MTKRVEMVTYPDAHILDVVGPLEVLTGAKYFLGGGDDASPYEVHVIAHEAGATGTTSGLTIQADLSFADAAAQAAPIDTLFISGGHGTLQALEDKALLNYVASAATRARRVVSICTGAMILAEVGLLEGKRATTHWWWCPVLAKRYPNVTIDPNAIYVRDGDVWTSAGVTAGMDLALSLVEMDFGHDVALQVARYNVMYIMRPGGQAQFSAHLVAQKADDPAIADAMKHIMRTPTGDLTVTTLAARAAMSERTFARKFKAETDMTPAAYVEAARLEAARVALEQSQDGVEQIAVHVGFISAERMRRAFQRHLGISPQDYRDRFGTELKREAHHAP